MFNAPALPPPWVLFSPKSSILAKMFNIGIKEAAELENEGDSFFGPFVAFSEKPYWDVDVVEFVRFLSDGKVHDIYMAAQ